MRFNPDLFAKRKGAALVEFALVFVVFVICVMGVLDLGRYLYMKQRMTHLLRSGIRASTVYDPYLPGNTQTRRYIFVTTMTETDGNVLLKGITIPTASGSQGANDALILTPSDAGTNGASVTAQLKLPFQYITPLLKVMGAATSSKSLTITVTVQSTNEP